MANLEGRDGVHKNPDSADRAAGISPSPVDSADATKYLGSINKMVPKTSESAASILTKMDDIAGAGGEGKAKAPGAVESGETKAPVKATSDGAVDDPARVKAVETAFLKRELSLSGPEFAMPLKAGEYTADDAKFLRQHLGLAPGASDSEVSQKITGYVPKTEREMSGLPPNATDAELSAKIIADGNAAEAAGTRKYFGLPPNASEAELNKAKSAYAALKQDARDFPNAIDIPPLNFQ
jgi:hypothetical protein